MEERIEVIENEMVEGTVNDVEVVDNSFTEVQTQEETKKGSGVKIALGIGLGIAAVAAARTGYKMWKKREAIMEILREDDEVEEINEDDIEVDAEL